jgi:Flp pilus assembly protein TadG
LVTARRRAKSQGGFVLLLSILMLLFIIIPCLGLAVDVGVLYTIKARLQTSVDAAALAAGRSISRGMDTGAQQAAAMSAARRWFHANFSEGYMGIASVPEPTVNFPAAPPRTFIVEVTATVNAPTYFMKIFRTDPVPVTVSAVSSRRDVNVVMVLDRSGSLYDSGSCDALRGAAETFVDMFANRRDKLGLVTFGTNYRVDYPLSSSFKTGSPRLGDMLGSLYCYGFTNAAAGYWTGYQQLVELNDPSALNVILFFTDGLPNTLTFGTAPDGTDNRLPVKTLTTPSTHSDPRTGYNNANRSPCRDSAGRTSSNASWSPSPLTGVITFMTGIYKKDASTYPASQAMDAVKIGPAEGNHGGCAFDAQFASTAAFQGGSPRRPIAGPGYRPTFDVAYLPEEDIFRNKTGTGYAGAPYTPVNRYDSSYPGPYQGKIRADDSVRGCCTAGVDDSITKAGLNALDNAAQRARADSVARGLNVTTFVVGLGNTPGGIDNSLLQRIANDPQAGNFNPDQPRGLFFYTPSSSQLVQAFVRIASEVLRLAQ